MQFLRGLDEFVDLSELSREISGLSNHNILGMGEKEKFFSVSKEVAVIMYIVYAPVCFSTLFHREEIDCFFYYLNNEQTPVTLNIKK